MFYFRTTDLYHSYNNLLLQKLRLLKVLNYSPIVFFYKRFSSYVRGHHIVLSSRKWAYFQTRRAGHRHAKFRAAVFASQIYKCIKKRKTPLYFKNIKNFLLTIKFNIRDINMAERVWLWSTEPNSRLWSKFSKKRKSTWVANPLLWQRYSQRFDVLESKTETMDGRYSKPACFKPSSPKQIFPSRSLFCVHFV